MILETSVIEKRKNFSRNNLGQRKESDFYETPYSMTAQLLESENFDTSAATLEPAYGGGAIVKVLIKKGFSKVYVGDISEGDDFLIQKNKFSQIITNPPYRLALEFVLKAKELTERKFAFLLPTDYIHGLDRFEKIFCDSKFPLSRILTFVRRPMLGDALRPDGKYRTGMQTYSWFIWDRLHDGPATIGWLNNQEFVLKAGE